MRVTLNNVLKYVNAQFEFPDGILTLLTGPSGSGKTSILHAISWCLYGSPNVDPRKIQGRSLNESCVRLEVRDDIVERRKRPNRLYVIPAGGQVSIVDADAQNWIYATFGPSELWNVTGYLTQWEISPLLSSPNSDKLEILRCLSFNIPPDKYIQSILSAANRREQDYQIERDQLEVQRRVLMQDLARKQINEHDFNLGNQMNEIENALFDIECKISKVNARVQSHRHAMSTQMTLRNTLRDLETKIFLVPEVSKDEIEKLAEKIDKIRIQQPIEFQHKRLLDDIRNTKVKLDMTQRRLPRDLISKMNDLDIETEYTKSIKNEGLIKNEKAKFARYGLNYDEGILEKRKELVNGMVNNEDEIRLAKVWSDVKWEFDCLGFKPTTELPFGTSSELESKINDLENLLRDQRLAQDVQLCPKCTQPLRIINSQIVISGKPPSSVAEIANNERQLGRLKVSLTKTKKLETLIPRLNAINKQMNELNISDPSSIKIPDPMPDFTVLRAELASLETFKYYPQSTYSSVALKDCLEVIDLRKKIVNWEDELSKLPPIESYDEPLSTLVTRHADLIRCFERRNTYTQQIEELKKRVLEVKIDPDSEKELIDESNKRTTISQHLSKAKSVNEILVRGNQLSQDAGKLNMKEQIVLGHRRLYDIARSIECSMIEEVTSKISLVANGILAQLFTEPISVVLSPFRVTKNNQIRMNVSLTIVYQGCELNGIKSISGGEGVRVSLALTLAISAVAPGQFLLLDESFEGLDTETIAVAIGVLKEVVKHKTVVIVMHDGIEGWFGHKIDLRGQV